MKDRISGYELQRWELLESIQPWGQRREDLRTALLCWHIACSFSSKPPTFGKVWDTVTQVLGYEEKEQTDEEIERLFHAIAAG